jgi:serine/threonine protein kinase
MLVASVDRSNPFLNRECEAGNYGQVYFPIYMQQTLCIKSFPFNSEENFHEIFPKIVHEWAMHRICSALQCAPNIHKILGFDLIIYQDCVQYITERGQRLKQIRSELLEELKDELRLMHKLKIIHFDIKPDNIVYSHFFNKPVFIDFGFSTVIA